jgi:LPS export ABC transporter permease LptF/LPS export ABC transporter permease LptG
MLVERYIGKNVAAYLALAALLLTVVLFSQQLTRFAEIIVSAKPAVGLLTRLIFGVVLNVAALALPIATLTGVLIGLSQMQADSELTAMRAAGIGNFRLLMPILFLGIGISSLAFYINLELGPRAADSLRTAGVTAALNKLDSPVEPRVFATDIPNYVVYVRNGDNAAGKWQQVFIYTQKKDGGKQIVTARSGGIDTSAEQSELVLNDAVMTTLPADGDTSGNGFVSEHLDHFRLVMDTGRKALVDRLRNDEPELDQLDWSELRERMNTAVDPKQRREAAMLFHRRLAISAIPIVFALLGAAIGLRMRRGGRGRGGIVALLVIAVYYLTTIFFEQQARTGKISPIVGAWTPPVVCLTSALLLLFVRHFRVIRRTVTGASQVPEPAMRSERVRAGGGRKPGYLTYLTAFPAILDKYVWKQLIAIGLFSSLALCLIFVIFTVFEMWKFVAVTPGGWSLLGIYLLFLMPFVAVQVLPMSTLVSSLTVYALLARRSEAIAWLVGGQSLYRLILPGLMVSMVVGYGLWRIQEDVMPAANLRQDTLRAQIRGKVIQTPLPFGARWAGSADSNTLFSFENGSTEGSVRGLTVYEFDQEGIHLSRLVFAKEGASAGTELRLSDVKSATFAGGQVKVQKIDHLTIPQVDAAQVFKQSLERASYVNASALSAYIKAADARGEQVRDLQLELYRKYSAPAVPIVMALLGMPFALLVGRKSVMTAASLSVGIGLAFWGLLGLSKQLSTFGFLSPKVAAWAPVALFFALGVYLISRLRS